MYIHVGSKIQKKKNMYVNLFFNVCILIIFNLNNDIGTLIFILNDQIRFTFKFQKKKNN